MEWVSTLWALGVRVYLHVGSISGVSDPCRGVSLVLFEKPTDLKVPVIRHVRFMRLGFSFKRDKSRGLSLRG